MGGFPLGVVGGGSGPRGRGRGKGSRGGGGRGSWQRGDWVGGGRGGGLGLCGRGMRGVPERMGAGYGDPKRRKTGWGCPVGGHGGRSGPGGEGEQGRWFRGGSWWGSRVPAEERGQGVLAQRGAAPRPRAPPRPFPVAGAREPDALGG